MSSDQPAPPSIPPRKPTGASSATARPQGAMPQAAAGSAPRTATAPAPQAPGPQPAGAGTATQPGAPTGAPPVRSATDPTVPATDPAPSAARARATAVGGAAAGVVRRAVRGATTAVTGTAPGSAPETTTAGGVPPHGTDPKADPTIAATDTAPRPATRPAAEPAAAAARDGGPRRVRLSLSRVDPWSVMKLSFLLSFAIGVMIVVAAVMVWFALDSLAVFTRLNDVITEIFGEESPIDVLQFVDLSRVVAAAAIVAIVDVILLTALSTIGAFLYNITAALVGGVNVTLTDE